MRFVPRKTISALLALLLTTALAWPGTAACSDLAPLLGAYYDSLNKVNVKGGAMLYDLPDAERPLVRNPHYRFKYADAELGLEGVKLTAGVGSEESESAGRIGLSYAEFRKQKLAGVEGVISTMGLLSVKLGFYKGMAHTPNRFMVGVGFGY